ncbi:hypothetical protein XBP1_770013 [Xenorhabdus bovienii str. puntauvense]|uniref:Uncharacterized protein n=1 Tax=Xenorhabdus bovienii str. puntauvense TaxID=1398201 RepID=A0A077NNI7_XENBV|nr:hypothetical protein XBP1_770013 [Xenorhabdus bovienii str. puntauvense]
MAIAVKKRWKNCWRFWHRLKSSIIMLFMIAFLRELTSEERNLPNASKE